MKLYRTLRLFLYTSTMRCCIPYVTGTIPSSMRRPRPCSLDPSGCPSSSATFGCNTTTDMDSPSSSPTSLRGVLVTVSSSASESEGRRALLKKTPDCLPPQLQNHLRTLIYPHYPPSLHSATCRDFCWPRRRMKNPLMNNPMKNHTNHSTVMMMSRLVLI